MKKYKVYITEHLTRAIEVEAESDTQAQAIAEEKYYSEEIVLDYTDLAQVEFDTEEMK